MQKNNLGLTTRETYKIGENRYIKELNSWKDKQRIIKEKEKHTLMQNRHTRKAETINKDIWRK